MTTGALMFAFNNEGIDYVKIAAWNANNIRRLLNIPVAVVTDSEEVPDAFDRVIRTERRGNDTRYFEDLDRSVTWYNSGRPDALDLTPWDRTLLLDADYVVNSTRLLDMLYSSEYILAFQEAWDITGSTDFSALNHFGEHQIPMWWATVMIFSRCSQAEYLFSSMKMIRANWQHYRDLYGIPNPTYRNDYALTIAMGILDGHTPSLRAIPWGLATIMPNHQLRVGSVDKSLWIIDYPNSHNKPMCVSWHDIDFHAMGKHNLEQIIASH